MASVDRSRSLFQLFLRCDHEMANFRSINRDGGNGSCIGYDDDCSKGNGNGVGTDKMALVGAYGKETTA